MSGGMSSHVGIGLTVRFNPSRLPAVASRRHSESKSNRFPSYASAQVCGGFFMESVQWLSRDNYSTTSDPPNWRETPTRKPATMQRRRCCRNSASWNPGCCSHSSASAETCGSRLHEKRQKLPIAITAIRLAKNTKQTAIANAREVYWTKG